MSKKEPLDFTAIEAALAALVPTTGGLDRDRLMYQAGRASVLVAGVPPRFRWAWPLATAAMTSLAAALLVVVTLRLADRAPRIVDVPASQSPTAAAADQSIAETAPSDANHQPSSLEPENTHDRPVADDDPWSLVSRFVAWPTIEHREMASLGSYASLRNDLLRDGSDAWPEPPGQAPATETSQPATYRQMLDSLLEDSGRPKPNL